MTESALARYHRQMLLSGIGESGQRKLAASHALVVGCGALGSVIVDALARGGVGTLTIVDRDVVELTNLQRQVLYDEADVADSPAPGSVGGGTPKAQAAKTRVGEINSGITVHAHVDDFNHRNAESLAQNVDIILDGLDNFETRYLLNDLAVQRGLPYIYGGAVGTTGVSMAVLPMRKARVLATVASKVEWTDAQATPCLRCVFPEAPPPGTSPTCDTAGVLGPVVSMIAAHQAVQAIKLLTGNIDAIDRSLLSLDAWTNELRRFDVSGARQADCPCCGRGIFEFLEGGAASAVTSLCGRNSIQISPQQAGNLDLREVVMRLTPHGDFACNAFLLRGLFNAERGGGGEPIELTLFPNGRAIIKGTTEPEVAKSIYAKYVGV